LRIDGLLCIAKRKDEDPELAKESLTFAESAETLLCEVGDQNRLFSALRTKADALYVLKRFDEAKESCLEAAQLAASQLHDHRAGHMFFNAGGGCAYNLKQYDEVIELYRKLAGFLESANIPVKAGTALAGPESFSPCYVRSSQIESHRLAHKAKISQNRYGVSFQIANASMSNLEPQSLERIFRC
jgi:tetratricopeptide (TPR) repeat protein